jgi:hydroxymethylpyrimidine/phosphomethylpyrimidine kinase
VAPRIPTKNTHGTGCTLSSAIACGLANGLTMDASVRQAKDYVTTAIQNALDIGAGPGPLGHLVQLYKKANLDFNREMTKA